jgi:hypothetical protein
VRPPAPAIQLVGAESLQDSSYDDSLLSQAKTSKSSSLNLARSLELVQKIRFVCDRQQTLSSIRPEAISQEDALRDLVITLQAELIPQQQNELAAADVIRTLSTKQEKLCAALVRNRKRSERQSIQLSKDHDFRAAVKVDNFTLPVVEHEQHSGRKHESGCKDAQSLLHF